MIRWKQKMPEVRLTNAKTMLHHFLEDVTFPVKDSSCRENCGFSDWFYHDNLFVVPSWCCSVELGCTSFILDFNFSPNTQCFLILIWQKWTKIHLSGLTGQDTLTALSQSYPVLDYLQALATL